jgi:hypothetical protein
MGQHVHSSAGSSETGQAQFAAIAKIVTLLRDDPETDWTQIDIKALRDHLVDMDNVTTKASAERTVDGLTVTFVITGDDLVTASIQRMVLAHSPMLQRSSEWTVIAEEQNGGATMLVRVSSDGELN